MSRVLRVDTIIVNLLSYSHEGNVRGMTLCGTYVKRCLLPEYPINSANPVAGAFGDPVANACYMVPHAVPGRTLVRLYEGPTHTQDRPCVTLNPWNSIYGGSF